MAAGTFPSRLALAALLATAAHLPHAAALGQEDDDAFGLSLEQLRNIKVLTATKTATPLYATPAVVTLITADDFLRYGYASVAEALAHRGGFIESNDGLNHNFGVRGLSAGPKSASRGIKILLDGQPVAFRSTQQQWTGLELVPVTMIERIEIVRGPVSVLYGADALLAAVNIITRRSAGGAVVLGVERAAGDRGATLAATSGAAQHGPWWLAWGLQGAHENRDGLALPRISPDYLRYAPTTAANDADPRSLYLRGGWRDGPHEAGASLFWQRQDGDDVFASLNPLLRPPTHVALQQGAVRLNGSRQLAPGHTLRAQLGYGEGKPVAGDLVRTGATDYYLVRDTGYRALDGGAEWLWQIDDRNSLLAGVDTLRDRETLESYVRRSVTGAPDFQLSPAGERLLRNTAWYVQYQFDLPWAWQGIAGVRRDRHSVYGAHTSYRLGAVGTLPGGWGVKVLGGTAFQAPSAELLYRTAVQPGGIRGNPDLAPQTARTVEVQLATPPARHWNGTLTLYRNKVQGLVTLEQAFFNLVARNSSDSTTHGAEIEARYQQDEVDAYVRYDFAGTRRSLNRYTLAPLAQRPDGELFPRHSAQAGASIALLGRRLLLSVDNQYVGKRPAATANVLLANQEYQLRAYLDTTFGARWSFDQHHHVRLMVRDAWNRRHVDPGIGGIDYPSPGRRWAAQYEYRF